MTREAEFALVCSRTDDGIAVDVSGEVDAATAGLLMQCLTDLVEGQGNLSVTVDLAGMTFIDSSGLSVLVETHRRATARGGRLVVANPRPAVSKVFDIRGMSRVLAGVAAPTRQDP